MELIYQLFVAPASGMQRALEGKRISSAGLVVILAILSNRIGWLLALPSPLYQVKLFLSMGLVIDLMSAFGSLFLLTAIFHLTANLSGGSGKGSSLYTVFSLSLIPLWMTTPLAIILRLWEREAPFLFFPLWLTILGWTVVLFVLGIREVYHFSWGKATAIFIFPLAGIGMAIVILLLLLLAILSLSIADILRAFPFAPSL